MMKALTLVLTFCIIAASSQARPIEPQPRANESYKPNKTMHPNQDGSCIYTATITTSCGSPPFTTDLIGLEFGDAYGNGVLVAKMDDPQSGRFKQCSTDIIDIYGGPCINQICYVQLIRVGDDGWMPETVTIHGPNSLPVAFDFNTSIPNGVWFGFDNC